MGKSVLCCVPFRILLGMQIESKHWFHFFLDKFFLLMITALTSMADQAYMQTNDLNGFLCELLCILSSSVLRPLLFHNELVTST